jgi:hypothetical protein
LRSGTVSAPVRSLGGRSAVGGQQDLDRGAVARLARDAHIAARLPGETEYLAEPQP